MLILDKSQMQMAKKMVEVKAVKVHTTEEAKLPVRLDRLLAIYYLV